MAKKGNENLIPEERVERYLERINIDTPRMRRLAKKVRKFRDYKDLNDLRRLQKISISPKININEEDFHTLDNAFDEYKKSDEFGDKEIELQSKVQSENEKFKKSLKDAAYARKLDLYTVNELSDKLDYAERPSVALSRLKAPSFFDDREKRTFNVNKMLIKDFLDRYSQKNESFRGAHNTLSDFQSGKTFKDHSNAEEQEKYMQLYTDNLEKDVKDTVDYFNALYSTKRARRGVRRIDKYAQKIIDENPEQYKYESMDGVHLGNINVQNESARTGVNKGWSIDIGSKGNKRFTRKGTLAHEIAHGREPFSYRNTKKEGQNNDSPYYNNDYSILRKKHRRWLNPEVPWRIKEDNPEVYKHDVEISEAFSDLAALRQDLYDAGIADGTKRRYRNKDIKAMRESSEFDSRYLAYHSNNNRVRKALNRIWANGGDMSNGENVESTPVDGGVLDAAVVTQDNDFNRFLATLPANQRETPEDKYHTYKMWKIAGKPKDFNQAVDMGLYHWNDTDKSYHGNSVIYDKESDVYHFLKPKDHSTVQYELDWFNKGVGTDDEGNQYELTGRDKAEWEDFRRNYYLDSSGDDYAYRRIPESAVPKQTQEKIMNALSEGVKAALQSKIISINQSLQEQNRSFAHGGRILDGKTEDNQTLSNTPETHYLTMQEAADISHNNDYAFMHPYTQDGSEVLLYPEELEQVNVTAFKSPQEANVYYGDQFGKKVAKGMGEAGQFIFDYGVKPIGNVVAPLGMGISAAEAIANFEQGNYMDGISSAINALPGASELKTGYKYADKALEAVDALKNAKQYSQVLTLFSDGGKINRFDIGGSTTSTETTTVETPHKIGDIGHNDLNSQRKIINQFSVRDENGNLVLNEEGKAQLTPIGYVATQNSKEFGKYKEYRQSKGEEIPSKRDNVTNFLYDWFNDPATIDILKRKNAGTEVFEPFTYTDENGNQVTYTPTAEEAVALRSFLADSVPEKYASNEAMGNTDGKYLYKNRTAALTPLGINLDSPVPVIKKVTNPNTGFEKQYYFGPEIRYKKRYDTDDVVLAEKVHAFQEQLMPYIFLGHNDYAYTKRPAEQHEKLMRIRAALGLDPSKRDYTFSDAKRMMSEIRKYENLEDDVWETEKSAPGSMSALFTAINNSASTFANMLNTWPLAEDPEKVKKELSLKYYSKGGRILDGKTKRMYGGNNDNFRSVAKMNARKLSSKTLK